MMKPVTVSAALALAFAGAACSQSSEDTQATSPEATIVEASATEDSGFNLMIPGGDLDSADDGWNLGVRDDVTEDGFVIPDGAIEDRLGDVSELPTGEAQPDLTRLPSVSAEPEDDVIRLD